MGHGKERMVGPNVVERVKIKKEKGKKQMEREMVRRKKER